MLVGSARLGSARLGSVRAAPRSRRPAPALPRGRAAGARARTRCCAAPARCAARSPIWPPPRSRVRGSPRDSSCRRWTSVLPGIFSACECPAPALSRPPAAPSVGRAM